MLGSIPSGTIQCGPKTSMSMKMRRYFNIPFKIGIRLVDDRITAFKNLLIFFCATLFSEQNSVIIAGDNLFISEYGAIRQIPFTL